MLLYRLTIVPIERKCHKLKASSTENDLCLESTDKDEKSMNGESEKCNLEAEGDEKEEDENTHLNIA